MKNRCVKVGLPNGKVADILSSVIDEMRTWIQDTEEKPESGGYSIKKAKIYPWKIFRIPIRMMKEIESVFAYEMYTMSCF